MVSPSHLIFVLLLISGLLFAGCTSPQSPDDTSIPDITLPLSQTSMSLSAVPAATNSTVPVSDTWGARTLPQNTSVSLQFTDNASYEVSLGNAILRQNGTLGSVPSYIVEVNITAKNTGAVPIEVIFLGVDFKDSSGDGCSSTIRSWCGVHDWFRIDPGISDTMTVNIPFVSSKEFEYLSSQKFILVGIINAETETFSTWNNRNSWQINLNNSI